MKRWVVIPTLDARERLLQTLVSLERQTVPVEVVVVDNASSDGTAEAVAERHPQVRVVRNARNLGFGAAVNRAVLCVAASQSSPGERGQPAVEQRLSVAASQSPPGVDEGDVLVLVNNDVVCEPQFVERITAPFADDSVGLAAGVLLQSAAPELVDSAGIELDATLGSWDYFWNRPAAGLNGASAPVGPCGGAAAYRLVAFRDVGGFDETLFAYWEDVDLALRLRALGWTCALAPDARAVHEHGQTLGAASPAARRLEAFGRGYVLAKYRVGAGRPLLRAKIAALDWPVLAVHLLLRREAGPLRARLRARALGLRARTHRAPLELATVDFRTALRRRLAQLVLRFSGGLPAHFSDGAPAPTPGTRGTPGSDHA